MVSFKAEKDCLQKIFRARNTMWNCSMVSVNNLCPNFAKGSDIHVESNAWSIVGMIMC